ncbi:MAG TPA: hypothetical protein P5164_16400 [Thermoanaerobaculia bacterium]|nr:hypothetical protein [Thermoanaerobaculia bacterium]
MTAAQLLGLISAALLIQLAVGVGVVLRRRRIDGRTVPAEAPATMPLLVPTQAPPRLDGPLAALAAGDFETTVERVRAERRRTPAARELDLVEAAALGARYVLEGRRDGSLLDRARASLASFRSKGGSARAEAALLSPALRALLETR